MVSAMNHAEKAIKAVTALKFYENYIDRNGHLSWEIFKVQIDEVLNPVSLATQIRIH